MNHWIKLTLSLAFLIAASNPTYLLAENATTAERIEKGHDLAFDRKKGNCLACHYIDGGTLMGNTGPALIAMKARFPDRQKLVDQIYDARTNNENTIMPPFGAHGALTQEEIEQIVDWLLTI